MPSLLRGLCSVVQLHKLNWFKLTEDMMLCDIYHFVKLCPLVHAQSLLYFLKSFDFFIRQLPHIE